MYDPTSVIFWSGFFACMFSIAPLIMLFFIPSISYARNDNTSDVEKQLRKRIQILEIEVALYEALTDTDLRHRTFGSR